MAPIIYGILAIVVFWFFFLRGLKTFQDIPEGYCHWCGPKPEYIKSMLWTMRICGQ